MESVTLKLRQRCSEMNTFEGEDSSQTLIITYCTHHHVPEDYKFHHNRSENIRSPTHVFFHHVLCGLGRHLCNFDLKLILFSVRILMFCILFMPDL